MTTCLALICSAPQVHVAGRPLGGWRLLGLTPEEHLQAAATAAGFGSKLLPGSSLRDEIPAALQGTTAEVVVLLPAWQPLLTADLLSLLASSAGGPAVALAGGAVALSRAHLEEILDSGDSRLLMENLQSYARPIEVEGNRIELLQTVGSAADLSQAMQILRARILKQIQAGDVLIEDLAGTSIDAGVTVGAGTLIRSGTVLRGATSIGRDCELGPQTFITDCAIGDECMVIASVLSGSEVGSATRIGPFAQLRPGCRIGHKVKIGNFVEVKNCRLDDGVAAGHLTYLGDAVVGAKTNIGAGTITCNYDGKQKHQTKVGSSAFVGSNSTLVAPITVGDGAFVAAGTVLTESIEPDALAIGRARQVTKPKWAAKRRALQEQS